MILIFYFQLFYLVTDLYKEGNAKEMKRWAYEIHSSFLVPDAPLRLNNIDENFAREIDEVLLNDSDKEEILRKVYLIHDEKRVGVSIFLSRFSVKLD